MGLVKQMRATLHSWRRFTALYAFVGLALAASVIPWLIRNYIQFGHAQMKTGGSEVLAVRVLLTEQPLLGALYVYSPSGILKRRVIEPLTGYTKADLKPGGRLHELVTTKRRRYEIFKERMEADGFRRRSG